MERGIKTTTITRGLPAFFGVMNLSFVYEHFNELCHYMIVCTRHTLNGMLVVYQKLQCKRNVTIGGIVLKLRLGRTKLVSKMQSTPKFNN